MISFIEILHDTHIIGLFIVHTMELYIQELIRAIYEDCQLLFPCRQRHHGKNICIVL